MATKHTDEAIQEWLTEHASWSLKEGALRKSFRFDSFRDSIVFVNRLASLADTADHHPDIDIRFNKVHVGLVTHDVGGISDNDTTMAEQIDHATRR